MRRSMHSSREIMLNMPVPEGRAAIINRMADNNKTLKPILRGETLSGKETEFVFYLRRPLVSIGLPNVYRVSLRVKLQESNGNTIINWKTRSPAYVGMALLCWIFLICWDKLPSVNQFSADFLLASGALVWGLLAMAEYQKSQLRAAFGQKIISPLVQLYPPAKTD